LTRASSMDTDSDTDWMEGEELPAQLPLELPDRLAASTDPPLRRSANQAAEYAGFEPPSSEGRGGRRAERAWLPRTPKRMAKVLELLEGLAKVGRSRGGTNQPHEGKVLGGQRGAANQPRDGKVRGGQAAMASMPREAMQLGGSRGSREDKQRAGQRGAAVMQAKPAMERQAIVQKAAATRRANTEAVAAAAAKVAGEAGGDAAGGHAAGGGGGRGLRPELGPEALAELALKMDMERLEAKKAYQQTLKPSKRNRMYV
jgi:hypothetical protein